VFAAQGDVEFAILYIGGNQKHLPNTRGKAVVDNLVQIG
jgi:hypothetical protein